MKRFRKITDGLYRGSAPAPEEVISMKKHLGINKIISLDKKSGERIKSVCNELGIQHIMLPLNGRKAGLANLLSKDLHELLMEGGPTFFHCAEGKDRTGMVAAMFRCLYMGWSFQEAMDEAKSLGFGVGINPFITGLYTNVLKKVCNENASDVNNQTIVSNLRSYKEKDDGRGSPLDQATQGSFAPYLSQTRQYPYDLEYNTLNDQSPTRQNYGLKSNLQDLPQGSVEMPLVGLYDGNAGVKGFGPAEPVGGFLTL